MLTNQNNINEIKLHRPFKIKHRQKNVNPQKYIKDNVEKDETC